MAAEIYAKAHFEGVVEFLDEVQENVDRLYDAQGLVDVAALLLARAKVIDNVTPGKNLVANVHTDRVATLCLGEDGAVDVSRAPHQIAAVDQLSPVLAEALDLERCDGRSIAVFLRTKMRRSGKFYYGILLSCAGALLSYTRYEAHAAQSGG